MFGGREPAGPFEGSTQRGAAIALRHKLIRHSDVLVAMPGARCRPIEIGHCVCGKVDFGAVSLSEGGGAADVVGMTVGGGDRHICRPRSAVDRSVCCVFGRLSRMRKRW